MAFASMKISPQRLRKLIDKAGYNNAEFAREMNISIQAIRSYTEERVASAPIKPDTLRRIAAKLGVPIDELRVREADVKMTAGTFEMHASAALPSGISPGEPDTTAIPEWTIDLRASHWAQVPLAALDYGDEEQREIVNRGLFRLTILGTCMEPDYPDGGIVEFLILRHFEAHELYHDYAVCKSDGTATFKRLQAVTEDELVLAALNQKDFPGEMRVARQEVSRLAIAVRRVMAVPEPAKVKVRKATKP